MPRRNLTDALIPSALMLLFGAGPSVACGASDEFGSNDGLTDAEETLCRRHPERCARNDAGIANLDAVATGDAPGATNDAAQPPQIPTGPLGGPGCGLDNAAFCETFDTPNPIAGSKTGDLNQVLWGVSRVFDANPGGNILNGWVPAHLVGCAGTSGATPPPGDVRICNGQLLEAVNDGGAVANLDIYPKQPFNFAGRTGKVVFDVSADSEGTHAAWPEFLITDEPVPGARRSISGGKPARAKNSIGFSIDSGCFATNDTTGIGVITYSINGDYHELQGSRPNCVKRGNRLAMNHFEVRLSQTHIEVWGTEPGSTTLKQLAAEDIPGGLGFTQGLVWMNDVHYNARKAIEPGELGTQWDHTFAWDNIGFDGPKTYRDLGFDVPDANEPGGTSAHGDQETNLGYRVGTGPKTFTVNGVRWDQTPTKAKVVFNGYSFDATPISVSVNGHTAVARPFTSEDDVYGWRSLAIDVPVSDVVPGANTLTFSSNSWSTLVANVSLIMVAGAPVP